MERSENEGRFIGWHRPNAGQPWRKAVAAESEAECSDMLEAEVEGGQTAVLPAGKHPLDHGGESPRGSVSDAPYA